MSLPCLRRTGLLGSCSVELWVLLLLLCSFIGDVPPLPDGRVDKVVPGRERWTGTLSPMIRTHSDGKKPTSKPRLPRHHMLSSGAGISMTLIISPTLTKGKQGELVSP